MAGQAVVVRVSWQQSASTLKPDPSASHVVG
eukprot:CAMPEP_0181024250 /NCGR_PEP_ID=MMETSP1070-20121207/2472_1 /TAXON_ID=265543 /ORGANISM="Minutocellus polymorphus, Strain NH13" /LENGTH=30 /DNA_ID= /DNA_START= /DNA_END= /DNA_ORIENTATION=